MKQLTVNWQELMLAFDRSPMDLEAVELPATLVARPQLELWPEILARVAVPDDVAEIVSQLLRQ